MDATQFNAFMQSMSTILQQQQQLNAQQQQHLAQQTQASTQRQSSQQQGEIAVNTALLPNFESFDAHKETFRNYKRRFENYIEMKNVHTNKEYCGKLLLNSIGATNFEVISSLAAPKSINEIKYDELMILLEKHLAPKRNMLVAQHQFLSTYQTETQSIAEYVAKLRSELMDCEFISACACKSSIADIFLRAQFIRGIRDDQIREQLLSMEKAATFDETVQKSLTAESSKTGLRLINPRNTGTDPTTSINKIAPRYNNNQSGKSRNYNNRQSDNKSRPTSRINYAKLGLDGVCLRCGRNNHMAAECRSDRSALKCGKCRKTGHVDKVCLRYLMNNASSNNNRTTHNVDASSTSSSSNLNQAPSTFNYGINQIINIYQNIKPAADSERFHATINIEGKPVQFEIDSGSGFTFLPRNVFAQLNINVPIVPTKIGFRSYTKDVFIPDGKVLVHANYNNISVREEIYIVPEHFAALLGRTWIRRLKINLHEIDNNLHRTPHQTSMCIIKNIDDEINQLKSTFPEIFEEKIGCVPHYTVSLKLRESATPVFFRERNIPYALTSRVEEELNTLEADGIITKCETSDWGSPLVVIPKKDGGVRLCVDYKVGVNERLTGVHYPIRKIDEILSSLRHSTVFSKLDLFKAYLHIPVDEKSSEIQSISTHRGTYRMNRLSFGIKTAPAEFNRIIDQILRDVPKTESYFDDIIVHGENQQECKSNLIKCLQQLKTYNLHLNHRKCLFYQHRIEFLGHIIEHNQISKSPSKIASIIEMPRPQNNDDVRRFLGLVQYYARFIPNTSTITTPLRKLLTKNTIFKWSADCQKSFEHLKQEIASDRVLVPYDPELPIQLACDASPTGIAGILSHISNNQERPIAFASRSLTQAEQNYSQLDREALAIVFAVGHFFQYVYGRPFKLITDNQPLVRIFHQHAKLPQMTSARLQRYAAFLSGFNYEVVFKRGTDNTNADCISRASTPINQPTCDIELNDEIHLLYEEAVHTISTHQINFKSIRDETRNDPELSQLIKQQITNTTDSEYSIDNGIIFRGQRVVIPPSMRSDVLQELHRTHIGITKMKQLARRYVYWKSIDKDIESTVRACQSCAAVRNNPARAPLHPWEEPEQNWQRIHIDYAGPFQNYFFLVIIDAKSKWAEIEPCTAAPTTASTIELLKDAFARHGFPEVIVSDNATIFVSDEMRKFYAEAAIFPKYIAPGHPATNGLAERSIQTLKKRLISMQNEPFSMRHKVREILFRYRATPLASGKTPADAYLHRSIRIQLDVLKPTQMQPSICYDAAARQLSVGDRVQARYYANNKQQWRFGTIINKFGHLHYMVRLDSGYTFKRHIDQLLRSNIPAESVTPSVPTQPSIREPTPSPNQPNLGDLVHVPTPSQVADHEPNDPIVVEPPILRRSNRSHRPPDRFHY